LVDNIIKISNQTLIKRRMAHMAGSRVTRVHTNNNIKVGGQVVLTTHVMNQFALRQRLTLVDESKLRNSKTQTTRTKLKDVITNEIRHSHLLNLRGNEEIRLYKGNKYVIKREFNKIVVITMLITDVTQKELFADKFHGEVDHSQYRKAQ
jgi:hypothetical protein